MFFENREPVLLPAAERFPKDFIDELKNILTVAEINEVLALIKEETNRDSMLEFFEQQREVMLELGIGSEKQNYLSRFLGYAAMIVFPYITEKNMEQMGQIIFLDTGDWLTIAARLGQFDLCDNILIHNLYEIQNSSALTILEIMATRSNNHEMLDWVTSRAQQVMPTRGY